MVEKNPDIKVLGEYVNIDTKIQVQCKKCGREYFATPDHLLNGEGCVICSHNHLAELYRSSKEELQAKLDEKGYPVIVLGEYINTKTNIKCHCKICDTDFEGKPINLLKGKRGCACLDKLESRGEQIIRMWLIENNINYIPQYSFKECCDKKPLRFDFFVPDKNLCIEYDGVQHFKVVDFSWKNTEESLKEAQNNFEQTQKRDKIKDDYCKENNINLLRIKYTEINNISQILEKKILNTDGRL